MGRGREQTAAGPRAGACRLRGVGRRCLAPVGRGAAGMRGRRCLPCGQRRCRVARRIMACRGRERVFRSGLPIREIYQRAGERGNGPHPAGDGDTRHLADRTRPLPGKTFHIILPPQTRRSTRHASLPVAENLPGARPRPAFRACLRPIRACLRPIHACLRPIPCHLRPSHTFCGHSMPVYGLFASLTAIPCLFTPFPRLFTVYPRLLRPVRTFYHPVPFTTTPRRALYGPYCAFYDLSASFAAHLCLLWLSRACLRLLCTFYSPSACVRKGQLPTLPATAFIPQTSRRENGGLCRHPLKGPG